MRPFRDSTPILADIVAMRARLAADGYLFLRDLLPRALVMDLRAQTLAAAAAGTCTSPRYSTRCVHYSRGPNLRKQLSILDSLFLNFGMAGLAVDPKFLKNFLNINELLYATPMAKLNGRRVLTSAAALAGMTVHLASAAGVQARR
jgi:hypothetical protein